MDSIQLPIIAVLIVVLCFIGYQLVKLNTKLEKFVKKNKELKTELSKYKQENNSLTQNNALLEAEQLKFQLQPHTLNNILANLKVFASKLNKGLFSLTQTLDYILYKGGKHLVSVKDELDFVNEYLKLNDLFIAEIDSISKDYSKMNEYSIFHSSPCIPHLITAYFLENAFKHGDLNHREFLKITVVLTDNHFEFNVANKIKKTPNTDKGGLGLINMNRRLQLLSTQKFEIKNAIVGDEYHTTLKIQFL